MCIKLLFDQNLSYRLVLRLKQLYPNSVHVAAIGLDKSSDIEVWNYAKEHGFTIVTKDSDFNDICTLYDFPPHILWLRLGNTRVFSVEDILIRHKDKICTIVDENKKGIIELT